MSDRYSRPGDDRYVRSDRWRGLHHTHEPARFPWRLTTIAAVMVIVGAIMIIARA